MTNSSQEVGIVKEIKDFLIKLDGLPNISINEVIENEEGVRGVVSSLSADGVEVLLLDSGLVQPKQVFRRLGENIAIPISQDLLGRAINPLGLPVDGRGPIPTSASLYKIEHEAPGISGREFIQEQFVTGISLVDTLVPLGKGQRELVAGDARSGKTSFLVDTVVNQKYTGVICVYAVIGKPMHEVKDLIGKLAATDALKQTVIVAATSNDLPPLINLAPKAALTIAEYFQSQGKDVLVVLDDMGTHAKIYREISLLANRSPGRESYPGDIFYQHAHILERAGKFNSSLGGGSITALPVIEINLNDMTSFIPTNLMAMTDGHLLFRTSISNQGRRPAIDISLSVSRVGQQTQKRVQNLLSTLTKQVLAQANELETVSRFSFDLPEKTQKTLKQREMIIELIKQDPLTYIPREVQTALLALPFTNFLQQDINFLKQNRSRLIDAFAKDPFLAPLVTSTFELQSETELFNQLDRVVNYVQGVINRNKQTSARATKPTSSSG